MRRPAPAPSARSVPAAAQSRPPATARPAAQALPRTAGEEPVASAGAPAAAWPGAASRSPERFGQQRVDEGFGVEHAQVFGALADAGEADRDAELARQRKHHAALG